jgi:hypothetical protein
MARFVCVNKADTPQMYSHIPLFAWCVSNANQDSGNVVCALARAARHGQNYIILHAARKIWHCYSGDFIFTQSSCILNEFTSDPLRPARNSSPDGCGINHPPKRSATLTLLIFTLAPLFSLLCFASCITFT